MSKRKTKPKSKPARVPIFASRPAPRSDGPAFVPPRPRGAPKSKKQQQVELAEAYRATRQSPSGERVIADLMLWCGAYNPIESNDPIVIARAMERRNMATYIAQKLGLRAEHFPEEAWRTASVADDIMGVSL